MRHDQEGSDGSVRTLARGLAVLTAVLDAKEAPTLTDIAQETGLHKATAARLLATLVKKGFLAAAPVDNAYVLGPTLAKSLRPSRAESYIRQYALPTLSALRDDSGESAALYTLAWPNRVCAERLSSSHPIQHHQAVGSVGPLTRGATGRAFLMGMAERTVRKALDECPLQQYTSRSVIDVDDYLDMLSADRENGFSLAFEESFDGVNGITAPIAHHEQDLPLAVINVSGPSFRWTKERVMNFAPTFVERVQELSSTLNEEVGT